MLQSLDRGLAILEYLSTHNNVSITEIAQVFQINKSTASRVMDTLAAHEMVFQDRETRKYCLGIGPLMFSYHVMTDNMIMDVARPLLTQLAETTRDTAHLCGLRENRMYVLDHVKSHRNRFMKDPTIPGMAEPFHCTAVGKVILAYMQPAEARYILENSEIVGYTKKTVTDVEAVMGMLGQIRSQGYALDEEELKEGVFCMAVPVFDGHGYATHSIGLTGTHSFQEYPERFARNLACLRAAGQELSRKYRTSGK